MSSGVIFWLVVGPFAAIWIALGLRYERANRKWFVRFMEREARRSERSDNLEGRLLRRLPRRPVFYRYVLNAGLGMATGRFGFRTMFRRDPDPEIEELRREAVARYRPMLYILCVGVVLWVLVLFGIALFYGVRWATG